MNLLAGVNYDPGTAVAKSCASLLAMTAIDTTNLRLTFTCPASGKVFIRIGCCSSGATGTPPQILLGVLDGSTVRGRASPTGIHATSSATLRSYQAVEFLVTGLTPGASYSFDAAYGVEVVAASTNIQYGGPDDTTTNNAWGGFRFEIWDPQPQTTTGQLSVDANGRVDVIKIAGTTQTARDIGASVLLSSGSGVGQLDFTSGVVKANLAQILGTALTETAGLLAGGFKKFFNIAGPVHTVASLDQTGDSYARIGAPAGASVSADVAAVKVDTAAVKVQTDKMAFTVANQIDSNVIDWKGSAAPAMTGDAFARLGAPAGASVSVDVAAVKAQTASIQTDTDDIQTRLPAALTAGGNIKADALAWNGLTTVELPLVPATAGRKLVVDAAGLADANAVKVGPTGSGTAQTAYDIGGKVGAPVGATISADIAATKALLPTALVGGRMDSSVGAMATDTLTAAALKADAVTEIQAGLATAAAVAALPSAADYTAARAAKLDNLDATVSSRLAAASYTAPLDAAATRSAVGLASANLDTQLAAMAALITAAPAAVWAVGSRTLTSFGTLAADTATAVGALVIETAYSLKDVLKSILAATTGKSSGGPATQVFTAPDGVTPRVTIVADTSGNRTSSSLTP